jgi:DEAD/DEAH box helicase domain-containing protein
VHPGAVHVHRGESYLVSELDQEEGVALVRRAVVDWTTIAREVADIRMVHSDECEQWGRAGVHLGTVEVTSRVVSYVRRRILTGEHLGAHLLDLEPHVLRTRAVWWTVPEDLLAEAGVGAAEISGAAHAAEHAAIALLRLVAACDRWDIGGVSTARHPDTGLPTVFVHDGAAGGAGFAERGYAAIRRWLTATRAAIASCPCEEGCPSCVQSPTCGRGNAPLAKQGAVRLLDGLLSGA